MYTILRSISWIANTTETLNNILAGLPHILCNVLRKVSLLLLYQMLGGSEKTRLELHEYAV